ncbi:hypothetical protein ACFU98_47765, partial [Streptomyces sp. NPDC057575]|uniref:hypothetical protein n=1 Tax=Streptomyces sp. NPDC057575 TaxID=3346170 RepID=UPI0036B75793
MEAVADYGEAIGTVQAYEGAPDNYPGVEPAELRRRVAEMRPATSKALGLGRVSKVDLERAMISVRG